MPGRFDDACGEPPSSHWVPPTGSPTAQFVDNRGSSALETHSDPFRRVIDVMSTRPGSIRSHPTHPM